jgi:recombination protein RecT
MSEQLATAPSQLATLKGILSGEKMREQFAAALPKHLTPERFCRVAITALTRTPKLAECTQESFFRCLLDLSAYGIEPDGRRAHLIPYRDNRLNVTTCTLILDWKGLAELAMRSGIIAKLHADIVCENDVFEYNLGEITRHAIDWKQPRGPMYAAYAMAVTKEGPVFVAVLNKEEIDAIRRRSKSGGSGPWVTDYNEMAKKTAFRRLAKWLPMSAEFRDAVEKDGDEVEHDTSARQVSPARSAPLDPFAQPPGEAPTIEAETEVVHEVTEPSEEDMLATDLLALVTESTAEDLAGYVEQANRNLTGAKQEMVKKAIQARAKVLGVKWDKERGAFV